MRDTFVWTKLNREHIAIHNVSPAEAQFVVANRLPPFPRDVGHSKLLVHGRTRTGRMLQVVFLIKIAAELDYEELDLASLVALSDDKGPFIVIIHARDLSPREISKARKHKPSR